MIPKIIHYCWLSGEKYPDSLRRCLDTWHKHFPEYELRLWDIHSFDFDSVPFTRDALAAKKWAFVSDYIRLYALYNYGGVYLDMDVVAFDKIDDLLGNRFFSGLEMRDKEHTAIFLEAAIMGSEKGHPFIGQALDYYSRRSFYSKNGTMDLTPIPTVLSEILRDSYGWVPKDEKQVLGEGIAIYATDTIANSNCPRRKSVKLYHLNNRSWIPSSRLARLLRYIKSLFRRCFLLHC